jgi:1-deoxy-D-xylulose-5-phosphate synthase
MDKDHYKLLFSIDSPTDLRKLSEDKLQQVCNELRCYIIDIVSENPGHFGASLGVVELTVALHYVYNTPIDQLIWDVGHQAYGHKILTGRRDVFHTNRKYGGISGFPAPSESPYDAFGVGHSSTSISAALGIANAAHLTGQNKKVIAVIGDGSLTGGMAFEALNNASENNPDVLIILNDNRIAIDPSVGGLHNYLVHIATSRTYNRIKDRVWKMLGKIPAIGRKTRNTVQRIENTTKSFIFRQGNLFESLNIRYFGPVDGHDIENLTHLLSQLKNIPGPKILHIITKKGKGYHPAEENQTLFHAPGPFDKLTGQQIISSNGKQAPLFQDVFGETIIELARQNEKIVGITPAMLSGCSLSMMHKEMPNRVFDVGIAEQHAVTFAAGLAISGLTPFCNIYSSFLQRAYDQVIHDVAIQKLNVVLCIDRGGLVGADGATHHGVYDLAYLRCIPNLTIASPLNEHELRNLMHTAQQPGVGPFAIRYPRGRGVLIDWRNEMQNIEIGKGQKLRSGTNLAILSIGPVGNLAIEAAQLAGDLGIMVSHYDMRFLKPIDEDLLHDVFRNHSQVITIEDGTVIGGLGSAVTDFMNKNNYHAKINLLGVPDRFIAHGKPEELFAECGYDTLAIFENIKRLSVSNKTEKSKI